MSGSISSSGLISGMDWETLISQLMSIERQPETRLQAKITALETEQTALQSLRTSLTSLRDIAQDFRLTSQFEEYATTTSDEDVATAEVTGSAPATGSYSIEVIRMATASVAKSSNSISSSINLDAALNSSGSITASISEGVFTINGQEFTISEGQSLNDVLSAINSNASVNVTATYNADSDRIVFTNRTAGDTSVVVFGGADDESNFLSAIGVTTATQGDNSAGTTQVTGTKNLGAVDTLDSLSGVNFVNGAVTSGSFYINGVAITIDASTDSMSDVIQQINESDAGVTASYDSSTDGIRVVSDTLGSRTVSFASGSSNFLDIVNLGAIGSTNAATQTAGQDSQISVNGGDTITSNSNEVTDAISGVTVDLISIGTTTVTISADQDAIVENVQNFITEVNTIFSSLDELTGEDGDLENDSSIKAIKSQLQSILLSAVGGLSENYNSLISIGLSTGDSFDAESTIQYELDTDAFADALSEHASTIASLFSNDDDTGIANLIEDYLTSIADTDGFIYQRAKSNGTIDTQIERYNDQIDAIEERVSMKETRLRTQFTKMEQVLATYQTQSSSLSSISSSLSSLI